MGRKGAKTKGKSRLAVDFKRVKSKVGKKVAPSRANTDTSFSAKGISLREQNLGLDKSRDKADAGLTRRGQSLNPRRGQAYAAGLKWLRSELKLVEAPNG